jgi:hypothetical protein
MSAQQLKYEDEVSSNMSLPFLSWPFLETRHTFIEGYPIFAGNVRTALRNSAISKVATHYELNKPGTTPSQVRSIVKQLLDQQRYILPYAQAPTPRAATSANPDATLAGPRQADPTSVTPDNTSPNPQDTSTNQHDNAGAKNMQKPSNAPKVNKVCVVLYLTARYLNQTAF